MSERKNRKQRTGVVVSDRMDKSITVLVNLNIHFMVNL